MKTLMLTLLFVVTMSFVAEAQLTAKSPEQRAAQITKSLQKKLNLTAEQASRVDSVFFNRATRMDSLKNNPSGDVTGTKLLKKSIQINADQQLITILNPDQQQQYIQLEKNMRQKRQSKKGEAETTQPMDNQ